MMRPEENTSLIGHEEAEKLCLSQWESGILPHAILISGARGIGKATFAYRLARFVLAGGAGGGGMFGPADLSLDPESSTFKRVASGAHGDLLVLSSDSGDEDNPTQAIKVDQARKAPAFLALTPAESQWRVIIIDSADDLNPNAANALLKMIEEPPSSALILLVSHSPGGLLPTIRSRCRHIKLHPLSEGQFDQLLVANGVLLSDAERQALYIMAQGSPGLAMQLHEQGAMRIYDALLSSLRDEQMLESLIKASLNSKKPALWQCWRQMWELLMHRLMLHKSGIPFGELIPHESETLVRIAQSHSLDDLHQLHQQARQWLNDTETLHLERKQVITSLLHAASGTTRL